MKHQLLAFAFIAMLIGCKSKDEAVKQNSLATIKTYFSEILPKEIENFKSLDSLRIISIDTVTEKSEMNIPIRHASDKGDYYIQMGELQNNVTKARNDIARLGSDLYGGSYVNQMQVESAKESSNQAKTYLDSALLYIKFHDSLLSVQKKADSTSLKYYAVTCLYQYTKKDLTFERDSAVVPISKDFKVITYEQIKKNYLKDFY